MLIGEQRIQYIVTDSKISSLLLNVGWRVI